MLIFARWDRVRAPAQSSGASAHDAMLRSLAVCHSRACSGSASNGHPHQVMPRAAKRRNRARATEADKKQKARLIQSMWRMRQVRHLARSPTPSVAFSRLLSQLLGCVGHAPGQAPAT